jgi:5'-methylthioadenosine phosphorylase
VESGHIAIIGGTGFEQLPEDVFSEPLAVPTTRGEVEMLSVSDNYVEPYKLFFLPRHGAGHRLAPHEIDYLANTEALVRAGVRWVLASNAVGSLRRELPPGAFVLLNDFIDFTRDRPATYWRDADWRHTDFTEPYSPEARRHILEAGEALGMEIAPHGTYICCDGPRFETPAEIRMFAQWGADVVGMTGLPEAVFCREAGLEYAAVGAVTNMAAGLGEAGVKHGEITFAMRSMVDSLRGLLMSAAGRIAAAQQAG